MFAILFSKNGNRTTYKFRFVVFFFFLICKSNFSQDHFSFQGSNNTVIHYFLLHKSAYF